MSVTLNSYANDAGEPSVTHTPDAFYVDSENKTFLVYRGPSADPQALYYDHDTGSYSSITEIATNPLADDNAHGNPSLTIDNSGYIHVFYGTHNDFFRYAVSDSPYDTSSWTTAELSGVPPGTYPSMAYDSSNDEIYVLYRTSPDDDTSEDHGDTYPAHEFATLIRSSDGGSTWTDLGPIIDTTGHPDAQADAYVSDLTVTGGEVHMNWWVAHGADHNGTRDDIFHAYYDPSDSTVYDLAGNSYGSTLTWDEHSNGVVQAYDGSNHVCRSVKDSTGDWHVTGWNLDTSEQIYVHWDGTSWTSEVVNGTAEGGAAAIRLNDNEDVEIHVAGRTNYEYDKYTLSGGSWTAESVDTSGFLEVGMVENAPDGKLVAHALSGDDTTTKDDFTLTRYGVFGDGELARISSETTVSRLETASGAVNISAFPPSEVETAAMQVYTGGGVGAIPLADPSDADLPYLRVHTAGGTLAVNQSISSATLPSSVVHQYDATALSLTDGDSGFTWPDSEGTEDMSSVGGATYQTDTLNGNPSVLYDGSDDAHEAPFRSTLTQANYTVAVLQIEGTGSDPATRVWSSSDSNERQILGVNSGDNTGDDDWFVFAGSSFTGGPQYDNSPHIVGVEYDGSSTALRYDGTESATGDAGLNDLPGIRLGSDPDDSGHGNFRVGEVLLLDSPSSEDISDAEAYLSDKWGITI